MSEVVEETRFANVCESEDAVDCNWAWMLLALLRLLLFSDLDCASDLGMASVFNRRRMPETA